MPIAMTYFAVRILIFLFFYLHCKKTQNDTYNKMRSATTRRLNISASVKKDDLIFSKIGQYRANLISRIEFVSTVSYKFITNTNL